MIAIIYAFSTVMILLNKEDPKILSKQSLKNSLPL